MAYIILILSLIALDQYTKFWIVANVDLYQHLDFLPNLMTLTYVQNTGAAFSMFSQHTWMLALVSFFLSLLLTLALVKKFFSRPLGQLGIALILAGAVGNLIDRAFRGFVVDMFHLTFMRFAVFNVADVCVCVGGAVCCYYYLVFFDKYDNPETKLPPETKTITTMSGETETFEADSPDSKP